MGAIKHDNEFYNALSSCSPNLVKFIKGLDEESADFVDFQGLKDSSLKMSDGTFFRIVESLRSYEKQGEYFSKGRKISKEIQIDASGKNKGKRYEYNKVEVTDSNKIITLLAPPLSRHNWGLAIDIIFRKIGYSPESAFMFRGKMYDSTNLKEFYVNSGILHWGNACGLVWGGNWEDLDDIAHFEDNSLEIPENARELYSKEIGYQFLSGEQTTENKNTTQKNSIIPLIISCAILLLVLNGGKK